MVQPSDHGSEQSDARCIIAFAGTQLTERACTVTGTYTEVSAELALPVVSMEHSLEDFADHMHGSISVSMVLY